MSERWGSNVIIYNRYTQNGGDGGDGVAPTGNLVKIKLLNIMYKLSWADIGSAHSLFQYVPKTSTPSTPFTPHRQLSDTYGLLIPEANSYSNSNPFSPTLRIYLFKANTLEAIAMSACTCGRSPTDNCVGWHNLTEDKYLEKKAAYEARKAEKAA